VTKYINQGSPLHKQMTAWRRDFHAHPETAYEEFRTSDRVAKILTELGLEVVNGLGGTGVVATLEGQKGGGDAIGLRADMDALLVHELNDFDHRSKHDGKMHACGHDGHTAMLLGAANKLSKNPEFSGKVHFIFQPAEEGGAGARKMIEEGLFERFPVKSVYALHNWPALKSGEAAVHEGAVMAAFDTFDVRVKGRGGHAGMPHQGVDPIVAAAQLITALQGIISRNIDPLECGVVSVTQIGGGSNYNVSPNEIKMKGTVRSFSPAVRDVIERRMGQLVEGICSSLGCHGELNYKRSYPATINNVAEARECMEALQSVPGVEKTHLNLLPSMAAEDFSFMLENQPGAYIWLGNAGDNHRSMLHTDEYDFNDDILPLGANYWISLVHRLL
jgi:hippurate hydrolase